MAARTPLPTVDELLRHRAFAQRLASGLVGDAAAAEDLVQETWRAALEHPPAADRPLRPWLASVVRNFARQRARSAGRRAARERAVAREEALPGPDEWVERLDGERALTEELAALPEPLRSTVLLRYWADLDAAEIARRQGLPAGTVRWRLKCGLDQLRQRLDRRFGARGPWVAFCLPLVRPTAPAAGDFSGAATSAAPSSGGAGAALSGAFLVISATKWIAASAALLLAYLGLATTGLLPAALVPWPAETPEAVSFRPLAAQLAPAAPEPEAAAETASPSAAGRTPLVLPSAPTPDLPAAPVAAEDDTVRLEAGLFDESGAPLAGGFLRVVEPATATSAPSDARGQVELQLGPEFGAGPREMLTVLVERSGFASERVEVRAEPGLPVVLGNFRLRRGGAVSGRLVDGEGRAVPGLAVTIGTIGDDPSQLEQLRYEPIADGAARTVSGPDGSFLLGGVGEGYVRLWASGAGWLATCSAPVEVRAGQESMGVVLRLEPLAPEQWVRGRVVGPQGEPVARAELDFLKSSRNRSQSGTIHADHEGRFRFVLAPGTRLSLVASDPEGRLAPLAVQDLEGGAEEQLLRLPLAARLELAVRGAGGRTLEAFAFRVRAAADDSLLSTGQRTVDDEGPSSFALPTQSFTLEVWAPGHDLTLAGPYAPAALGSQLEVELTEVVGLRGQVTAGGVPLAGATVQLCVPVADDLYVEHNGFAVTLEPAEQDSARSDELGAFLLTPRQRGTYFVRAEHPDYAPTELGPLELDPTLPSAELLLALGAGGAIEGRVITPPGPDGRGRVVGVSRGDGHARTQRAGPGGSFRFERLTPGPWQVRLLDAEIHPERSHTSSTTARSRPELVFDCEVQEGRTTRFDLDLAGRDAVRLVGELRLDGRDPGAWRVALTNGFLFGGAELAETGLDGDGRFELVAPAAGSYRLVLMGAWEERALQALVAPVTLRAGSNPWGFDLPTGRLTVENLPPNAGGDPECLHLWEGPGGVLCLTALVPDGDGNCLLPRVPVGPGRLVALADQDPAVSDPAEWVSRAPCEVRSGAENRVRWP
jgi:RNA polymerase sigma factor (sigma-70 family)